MAWLATQKHGTSRQFVQAPGSAAREGRWAYRDARYLAGRLLWRPAAQLCNGFDEYPVKAFNIFVDFYPLDADCFRVGEELVCEFSDKHCIGRRCLGDLISDPFVQKTDAACAHPKIHQAPRLQTASTRTAAEIIIPLRFCHFGGGLGTSFSEWLSIRDKLW
ncbi:hypothetical protein X742_26230 [Mesorhizobium sp. LNHC232B00]|nr:hypothetical protein X742_26230 [Mesorhizobium sp. LNHC232B00]